MKNTYLVAFVFTKGVEDTIRHYMNEVAKVTGLPPPSKSIPPHVSWHKPLTETPRQELVHIVGAIVRQCEPFTISTGGIMNFGKHFITLPLLANYTSYRVWNMLHNFLAQIKPIEYSGFERENTLHITLAEKTTEIFDSSWEKIKKLPIEPLINIPIEKTVIYQKDSRGYWVQIEELLLPAYS